MEQNVDWGTRGSQEKAWRYRHKVQVEYIEITSLDTGWNTQGSLTYM